MGSSLSFAAALYQLGNVSYQAFSRLSPFKKFVVISTASIPIAAVTLTVSRLALSILSTCAEKMAEKAGALYRKFRGSEHSCLNCDDDEINNGLNHPPSPIPRVTPHNPPPPINATKIKRVPPDHETAKERNEALTKMVDIIDENLFDPWILKNQTLLDRGEKIDPLFEAMIAKPDKLKSFLRLAIFYLLTIKWDEIEQAFVDHQMRPPDTLESICETIQALELEKDFESQLLSYVTNEGDSQKSITQFSHAVLFSQSETEHTKPLWDLVLRLSIILQKKPKDAQDISIEEREQHHRFSVIMNHFVAGPLKPILAALKEIMNGVEKLSLEKSSSDPVHGKTSSSSSSPLRMGNLSRSDEEESSDADESSVKIKKPDDSHARIIEEQNELEDEISESIKRISSALATRYSEPLYKKYKMQQEEGSAENCPEKAILSQSLGTKEMSHLFFWQTISISEQFEDFHGFIERVPHGLLNQIKPALVTAFARLLSALSQVSMEQITLGATKFVEQILQCCQAMQHARNDSKLPTKKVAKIRKTHLSTALIEGGIEEATANKIAFEYSTIPRQENTENRIIDLLGNDAHELVTVKNPKQAEKDWIDGVMIKLKKILRETTSDYTKIHSGEWLAPLLRLNEGQDTTGVIGIVLSLFKKVQSYPGASLLSEIGLNGIQKSLETKGVIAIQEALDRFSSAGVLSSKIAIVIMNSLLDVSTSNEEWLKKLSLLQEAYSYLSSEEQQKVIGHLKFLYQGDELSQKENELKGKTLDNQKVNQLLKKEKEFTDHLRIIEQANEHLQKQDQTEEVRKHIQTLKRSHQLFKSQKEITQLERVSEFVVLFLKDKLQAKFNFTSGTSILKALLTTVQESFRLLRYQKVVKHGIFTIVDLLIKELERVSKTEVSHQGKPPVGTKTPPSILEIIEQHGNHTLLDRLFTIASNCNPEWNMPGILVSLGNTYPVKWGVIWPRLKINLNEASRITPEDLVKETKKATFNFAKSSDGLSTVIIEALTEHVADPRIQEPTAPNSPHSAHSSSSRHKGKEDSDSN